MNIKNKLVSPNSYSLSLLEELISGKKTLKNIDKQGRRKILYVMMGNRINVIRDFLLFCATVLVGTIAFYGTSSHRIQVLKYFYFGLGCLTLSLIAGIMLRVELLKYYEQASYVIERQINKLPKIGYFVKYSVEFASILLVFGLLLIFISFLPELK